MENFKFTHNIPAITIRNRHTGQEKNVSEKTAEIILNTHAFSKDWEILKTPQPVPGEVIQFQTAKLKNEEYPETLDEKSKTDYITAIKAKEQAEADKKARLEALQNAEFDAKMKEISQLSIKKLSGQLEFLTPEQLKVLLNDDRVTVKRMATDELEKRKS